MCDELSKKYLNECYNRDYAEFLNDYCHEGLKTQALLDDKLEVYICSHSVIGEHHEFNKLLKELADYVIDRVNNHNEFGC